MKKRLLFASTMLLPLSLMAQAQPEVADSLREELSLVGVIDASAIDNDAQDGDNSSQDINTSVLTSHDVFLNKAGYQLSGLRFRTRGYENIHEQRYINGVPFNDQLRGVFNYAAIGAMNDLTRNGDETYYTQPGTFTFGALGGAQNILMRASQFARGGKVTLSYTNRTYYLRGMASYSTGLSKRGWAFTGLVGGRYSDEGNIDGTYYRNFAYAFLLEKQWQDGIHSLSLATFGSPVNRGQQGGAMDEVYQLTGNNLYNPNWGYQNGKKRNSRIVRAFDPTTILTWNWKIKPTVEWQNGLAFHYGRYGSTALNWYDGADPRPDYYRYLPSYFESVGNTAAAELYANLWRENNPAFTQVNWESLYNANANSVRYGNGSAIYMLEERRSDLYETTFSSTINAQMSKRNRLTAGLVARNTVSRQFKTAYDLLGAAYVLDVDKYADTDYPGDENQKQMDLNNPNRKVYTGDKFGYDFRLNINSIKGWITNNYTSARWDGYYGIQVAHTDFFRYGYMKNGHYPTNSYGAGKHHNFTDLKVNGGLTYKISGRQLLSANVLYGTDAPLANDAYISPRTNDATPVELKSGRTFHVDLNYIFSTAKFTGRVSLFETHFKDQIERTVYYDNDAGTLVNYVMTGVNRIHRGLELGATYKLDDHWSFDLAGTLSEYYYGNNPQGYVYADNGTSLGVPAQETVYMKNLKVSGTPQVAGTFGIRYFVDYWFLGANINGIARNYVDVTPGRRVASKYTSVTPDNVAKMAAYENLTHQERFGSAYTVDLSIGKIFYLNRKNSINVNIALNNILNRRDIKTGGYEQGRMDLTYPNRYKAKYFYAQGFNAFVNVSYKF
ncbi:MAG: TonB-dependent receptor [Alloprevotella sp.]|nr:TonB-dependent receptor [Bacteroidales bacterium]MDY3943453.1 TonB-dependent receptor [Alloprevotella sp.]